jgi:hypothetical protein
MKAATLAFLFALLLALGPGGNVDPYHQPLSMFRDGPRWLLGYTLFALLALIGALMVVAFFTTGRHFDAGLFSLGAFLLAIIAVTPSESGFHFLCSLALFFLLYAYYAVLLHWAVSAWRFVHWLMPLTLALVTGFQSYGLWQKVFIVYCVLAITVHHHLLTCWIPKPKPSGGGRGVGRAAPLRKRVVYVVEDGEAWDRRR